MYKLMTYLYLQTVVSEQRTVCGSVSMIGFLNQIQHIQILQHHFCLDFQPSACKLRAEKLVRKILICAPLLSAALMGLLGVMDFLFVNHACHSIITRGASVQLVFGFEVCRELKLN